MCQHYYVRWFFLYRCKVRFVVHLGCVLFIGIAVYFFLPAEQELPVGEKWAFAAFFAGAIVCMGFSFLYHTLYCHSERVGLVFGK